MDNINAIIMGKNIAIAVSIWLAGSVAMIPSIHAQEWRLVESGVTSDLYDIQFIDYNTGWAVGADSTIIKTTDGGHTWFRQTGGVAEEYRCVYFRDSLLGWIGGTMGTILHTTNGGYTWERQTNEDLYDVNRILFINDTLGWLGGTSVTLGCGHWGYDRCGILLKTTDGGQNWKKVVQMRVRDTINPENSYDGQVTDLDFINEQQGFAVASSSGDRGYCCGAIIYTSDGGETWGKFSKKAIVTILYSVNAVDIDYLLFGGYCIARSRDMFQTYGEVFEPYTYSYDISVPDTNHIYSISSIQAPIRILLYKNGSLQAEEQLLEGAEVHGVGRDFTKAHYMGICMLDSTTGWVCGDTGKLWKTEGVVGINNDFPYITTSADIQLYPNPVNDKGQLNIKVNVAVNSVMLCKLYDMCGRSVYEDNNGSLIVGANNIQVLPVNLQKGLYYMRVSMATYKGLEPYFSKLYPVFVY